MIDNSISLTNESTEDAPATTSTPMICASQGNPPCWYPETTRRVKEEEEENVPKEGHGLFLLEPPCPLFGRYKEKVDIDFTKCGISNEERQDNIKSFLDACHARRQLNANGDESEVDVLRKWSPPPLVSSRSSSSQYVKRMSDARPSICSAQSHSVSPSPPPLLSRSDSWSSVQEAWSNGNSDNSSKGIQARWKRSFDEIRKTKPGEPEDTFIKSYDTLARIIDDFSEKAKLYAQVIITEVK